MRADSFSPNTIRSRTDAVRAIALEAGVAPEALTRMHVATYFGERRLSPETVCHYLDALGGWFEFLERPHEVETIRRPHVPRRMPHPVSETGLTRMLLAADRARPVFAWIVLGAWCGCRSFESAKIRAEDLEETPGGWSLRIVGKAGVDALVPAPEVVVRALRPWIDAVHGSGRLWPAAKARSVQDAIRRVAAHAGVHCTSHMLRHRYGTAVYATSTDLLLTQQLMRHSSPNTTAGYAKVAADKLRPVVDRLPGADRITRGQAS